jgi:hypothetical protein
MITPQPGGDDQVSKCIDGEATTADNQVPRRQASTDQPQKEPST